MTKDLNLKFTVTDNGLYRNNDIKYLSATNDIYEINLFYYGDYADDLASGNITVTATSVACKSDGLRPDLKYINGYIYISIIKGELLYVHRIDECIDWLEDAKASAIALADLLKEYKFPVQLR